LFFFGNERGQKEAVIGVGIFGAVAVMKSGAGCELDPCRNRLSRMSNIDQE
jgi:hypothetical protein